MLFMLHAKSRPPLLLVVVGDVGERIKHAESFQVL